MRPRLPIIVIGAARSGTKWVRSILASCGAFRVVPYDVNHIWRHGQHWVPHDALDPVVGERRARTIRSLLDRAALPSTGATDLPILEKTVSNALRVPLVRRVFPEARFVEIVRDGREAIASTYEQWTRPGDRSYALRKALAFPLACWPYLLELSLRRAGLAHTKQTWGVRYPGIDEDLGRLSLPEVCALQWAWCIRGGRDLDDLPSSSCIRVRYEDLCRNELAVRRLAAWAGLPEDVVVSAWKRDTVVTERRFHRTFDESTRGRIAALVGKELEACAAE